MRPLLALLLLLVLAAPARAAGPEVGIADDRLLLAGGPEADAAIAEWQTLGVQQVRIFALWSRIGGRTRSAPYEWDQLDRAVDRVVAAGMEPMLTITGPGPLWASREPERGDPRWDPDPALFAGFAGAVARRYADRVDRYVLWNEPNLSVWLKPQAVCFGKVCNPVSPHLYRDIVRAAYPAIHAGDPDAQVLIGATSSRGGELTRVSSTLRPLVFLRALGCVDTRFRKVRNGRCNRIKPAPADGIAFHPHGVLAAPEKVFPSADDVSLASLPRLERALDKLTHARRLSSRNKKLNLYLDELGYQTDPPDVLAGVSLKTQDAWLQRAAYQAWRDKRVKLFSQYLWMDEPRSLNQEFGGWQSGLRFEDGKAKPSLAHFSQPFAVDARRNRLWGQVRRRNAATIQVQRKLKGSSSWRTIGSRKTDSEGYWSWTTRLSKGATYRFQAAGATSAAVKHG
jgi:hypothetical protein